MHMSGKNHKSFQIITRGWSVCDNGHPFAQKFAVSDIGYDENRKINKLVVVIEQTGAVVYRYGVNGTAPKKATSPKQEAPKATAQKPVE